MVPTSEGGNPKVRVMPQPRAFIAGLWLTASALAIVLSRVPTTAPRDAVVARVLFVAFLFACAEVFVVHVRLRRNAHTFSFAEIALVVGLFAVAPIFAVIAAAVGSGLSL